MPQEIKIAMLGARGVGKTSFLTAMYEQFESTIGQTNLQLTPDLKSAAILQERLGELKSLTDNFESTGGVQSTEAPRSFIFDLGKKGTKPSLRLHFQDFPGEYIASEATDNENECTLRSLAAFALRDKLEKEIDSAVHSRGEIGFEFSLEDIQKLPKKANAVKQHLPLEKEKIKQNSEGNKGKLAIELEEHCLPKRLSKMKLEVDPLVIVTGIQDKETLDNAGVWRGMSSLITEDKEGEHPQNALVLLFKRVSSPILGIGFSRATLVLIPILYFTFQMIPIQSPATIPSCLTITHESLIFYARQSEVDVGDESVIKVLYNPQEIKTLVLVDKDEKPFNAAESKTNNDGKRELTYRTKFDTPEMYSVRIQGTKIATDKPICEQRIYINVRPE